ncbi:MAG: AAA family ATPase [Clostridia bacterium]|nr:AAA family ATPase [Clostridia bacterium]
MKSIEFKNYKRFREKVDINFSNVTFLVGTNNAGKSTVNTALDFLTSNLKSMGTTNDWFSPMPSFKIPSALGEYGRIHNMNSDEPLEFSTMVREFILSFEFNEANNEDKSVSVRKFIIEDLVRGYKLTATRNSTIIEWMEYDEYNYPESWKDVFRDDVRYEKNGILTIDYLIAYIEDTIRNYKQSGASVQDLESLEIELDTILDEAYQLRETRFNQIKFLNSLDYTKAVKLDKSPVADDPTVDNLVTPYLLSNCLISVSKYWKYPSISGSIPKYIAARIQSSAYSLEKVLNQMIVKYLPVHILEKSTVFLPSHPLYELIDGFYKRCKSLAYLNYTEDKDDFLKYLDIFGVAKDIRIKSIGGVAYTLELLTVEGEWTHLSDMGTGTMRIVELSLYFQLLTRIAYIGGQGSNFILVEEPEQNLHPKYQSLLCDFFQLVSQKTGYKIIVETHSEYLIRRSQVLVAEMKFNNEIELDKCNPFKVYYFPEDDSPYEMVYRTNGYFEQSFGSGFFDEASKWSRHLMRINNN